MLAVAVACSRSVELPPRMKAKADAKAATPHAPTTPSAQLVATAKLSLAQHAGTVKRADLLTLIDLGRPSPEERLWVLDTAHADRVVFQSRTSHATLSEDLKTRTATKCSNQVGSRMTAPGAYVTLGQPRAGKYGLSLAVDGLDKDVNDNARERAILFHTNQLPNGHVMGTTDGCFTVPVERAEEVLKLIAGGTFVYVSACGSPPNEATKL